jgi:hypothetical protein
MIAKIDSPTVSVQQEIIKNLYSFSGSTYFPWQTLQKYVRGDAAEQNKVKNIVAKTW